MLQNDITYTVTFSNESVIRKSYFPVMIDDDQV